MADPLSVAGSIAGLISIGDMVFRRLYQYAKSVAGAEEEAIGLKDEVAALTGVLHNLHLIAQELEDDSAIHNTIHIDHVKSCLGTLYKINKILAKMELPRGKTMSNAIQRLKWPIKSSEIKALNLEVQKHRETLSLALSADSMVVLLQSLSSQKDVVNRLDKIDKILHNREISELRIRMDNERKSILQAFFAVEPRHYLETVLDLRHPTTGFWLEQHETFQTWLRETGSRLWLSGIPGAGKTIFSGLIIQECFAQMGPKTAVAYFYCDYKNKSSQDVVNLLSALAGQIAMKHESSFLLLKQYHESLYSRDQMERKPKAAELVKLIHEMASELDDVRIVIDGLDECIDQTRQAAGWLRELIHSQTKISFVLLSRDDPDIRGTLIDLLLSHIEITAHTEDIEHYVRSEIEQRMKDNRLRIRSNKLKDLIIEQLVTRAQGMFRWVSCQLDFLCELPTDSERRQALGKLPESLNETYERILLRIKKPAVPLVVKCLQWLMFGFPKLSIEELLDALSIDDESDILDIEARPTEEDLMVCCSSLVRRTGTHIELAHFTVQEYIQTLNTDNPYLNQFGATSATSSILAARCLKYLCSQTFDRLPPSTVDGILSFRRHFPFHGYAASSWTNYMTDNWTQSNLIQLCHELFDPRRTLKFIIYITHRLIEQSIFHGSDEVDVYYSEILVLIRGNAFGPLHAAAMMGSEPLCRWLTEQGCDMAMVSLWGSPLDLCCDCFLGIRSGYGLGFSQTERPAAIATVSFLLESGARPTESSPEHEKETTTLLSSLGLLDTFKRPLKTHLDPTSQQRTSLSDQDFCDSMGTSVDLDQAKHVEKLLLDPRSFQLTYNGLNILDLAASFGALQVLQLLFEKYRHAIENIFETSTPLIHSMNTGTESSSLFLMDSKILTHHMLHDPVIVYLSVARGFSKCLDKLMTLGVDIKVVTDDGHSAWFFVTQWTAKPTYAILRASGLDPLQCDRSGVTVLQAILAGKRQHICTKFDFTEEMLEEDVFDEQMADHLITPSSVKAKTLENQSIWFLFCTQYIRRVFHSRTRWGDKTLGMIGKRLIDSKALDVHDSDPSSKNSLDLLIEQVIEASKTVRGMREHWGGVASLFVTLLTDSKELLSGGEEQMRALFIWAIYWKDQKLAQVMLQRSVDLHVGCSLYGGRSVLGAAASFSQNQAPFLELMTRVDPKRLDEHDGFGMTPIHAICGAKMNTRTVRELYVQRLRLLLSAGASPNAEDREGMTPLHVASIHDFVEGVQLLVEHGADVHHQHAKGRNVIYAAIINESISTLRYFHIHMPDDTIWQTRFTIEARGSRPCTGSNVHLAACYGITSVLEFLKHSGRMTNMNEKSEDGSTPLHLAVLSMRQDAVDWLIDNGGDVNAVTHLKKQTALHFAMRCGNFSAACSLITAGADSPMDDRGLTPEDLVPADLRGEMGRALRKIALPQSTRLNILSNSLEQSIFAAIRSGDIDLCRSIVRQNPRSKSAISLDCGSCTPLITALCSKDLECIDFLLENEATTAGQLCRMHGRHPTEGLNCVHIAASNPLFNPKLATLLELSFKHTDHWTRSSVTPAHLASVYNAKALPILYQHTLDNFGRIPHFDFHQTANWEGLGVWRDSPTPLHTAAAYGNAESIAFLLDNGADADKPDSAGMTALHRAAASAHIRAVLLLLSRGANPNARTVVLETALHLCVASENIELAEALISKGVDKNAIDFRGRTALHSAAIRSRLKAFIALVDMGCDPTIKSTDGESALTAALRQKSMRGYILNKGFDRSLLVPPLPPSNAYVSAQSVIGGIYPLHIRALYHVLPEDHRRALINSDAPMPHILVHASANGLKKRLVELIKEGADIDFSSRHYGSALIAACRTNRLNVVKILVYHGARLQSVIDGKPITALEAARDFPAILHWLLVGRHHEQLRITNTVQDKNAIALKPWSGIRQIGIPLEDCFSSKAFDSRLEFVEWIYMNKEQWENLVPVGWEPVLWE